MPDAAPVEADPYAEAKAELELRFPSVPPPNATTTTESANAPGGPGGTAPIVENAPKGPASPGSPNDAPKATAVPDLKHVDEKFRPYVEKADPETQAYFARLAREDRDDRLRFADYTRKNQVRADAERALEARKVAADFGESIMSRKELLSLVQAKADELDGKEAAPKFDPTIATPEEWEAEKVRIRKETADEVFRTLKAEQSSTRGEVETRQALATAVLDSFKGEQDEKVVNDIFVKLGDWDGVRDLCRRRGVDFNAENVSATLREFLPAKASAPAKDNPTVTEQRANVSTGASALTRGVGTAPTLSLPKHLLENRKAASVNEIAAEMLLEKNRERAAKGLPLYTFGPA